MAIQIGARNSSVGDIRESVLTELEFQSLNGTGWVLMDGRNIAGSTLAQIKGWSTIPDARGQFLRGKNNGRADGNQDPGGERALGNRQGHAFQTHNHNVTDPGHTHQLNYGISGTFESNPMINGSANDNAGIAAMNPLAINASGTGISIQNKAASGSGSEPTTAETRPANIAVNIFIKIN